MFMNAGKMKWLPAVLVLMVVAFSALWMVNTDQYR